jgi:hypothetical protein
MFESVDLYCERLDPTFWAEPVNALTNISFLIGAWFAYIRAKQLQALSASTWLLLALMCAIAIGSFLFHTYANQLTHVLDIIPILLFQLVYLWHYCREVINIRPAIAGAIILSFFLAAILGRQMPHILNGSLIYAPALIMLLLLGIYHLVTRRRERTMLLWATLAFIVSLTSRSMDMAVCPAFPLGTHFLWHLFNGLVLYLLFRGYMSNRQVRTSLSD